MFLPADQAVRPGVLLVLLTPCVDYVIVFSGLAGGSSQRLLAAIPLLPLALLPLFLFLFLGSGLGDTVEAGPFLKAFLFLIVIPLALALAWLTQAWTARNGPRNPVDIQLRQPGQVGAHRRRRRTRIHRDGHLPPQRHPEPLAPSTTSDPARTTRESSGEGSQTHARHPIRTAPL